MNGYIALKPVTLSGVDYVAGDSIPAEAVLPNRVRSLLRIGTIAKAGDDAAAPAEPPTVEMNELSGDFEGEVISLPIEVENGVMGLPVGPADICEAIRILQLKAENAVAAIAKVASGNVLIILNACDSRSTVKKAAQARAAALTQNEAEETGTEEDTAETGGDV